MAPRVQIVCAILSIAFLSGSIYYSITWAYTLDFCLNLCKHTARTRIRPVIYAVAKHEDIRNSTLETKQSKTKKNAVGQTVFHSFLSKQNSLCLIEDILNDFRLRN